MSSTRNVAPPPEARISGWLKSKAASLEGHVKEMRENTKLIAQVSLTDAAVAVQKGLAGKNVREERFDVTFQERALGIELDLQKGATVRLVKPGGQAERLDVHMNDRLVAVAGTPVPDFDPHGKNVDEFIEAVKSRMSNMPRPVTLTFARLVTDVAPAAPADDGAADPAKQRNFRMSMLPLGQGVGELQSELAAALEAVQRYECDAALAREDAATALQDAKAASEISCRSVEEAEKLRADLADIRLSRAWGTQEASCQSGEVDEAREAAAEARAALVHLDDELRHCTAACAEAESFASVEERAAHEHRDLAERRASAASEALEERFVDMERTLREELATLADRARRDEATAASSEQMRLEGERELSRLRETEAVAREEAEEATACLERVRDEQRRRDLAAGAAERLTNELRREVERLRNELRRMEAAKRAADDDCSGADAEAKASVAAAAAAEAEAEVAARARSAAEAELAAEARVAELTGELSELQARLQHEEERAQAVSQPAPFGVAACSAAAPSTPASALPQPSPEVLGKPEEALDRVADAAAWRGAGADGGSGADDTAAVGDAGDVASGDADTSQSIDLKGRIAELETRNASLARELSSRPIVYQFAPLLDEEADDEDDEDNEEAPALAVDASGDQSPVLRLRVLARGAGIWLKRRGCRRVGQCRRMGLAKWLEYKLKSFTNRLLARPMLLWLFYGHVIVLWMIEVYRQARSQPSALDPSSRLEIMVRSGRTKPLG